ncbi:hypothetical protein [Haliangium sp.]|uniref:hypothetical protein n=1 Tax=Haliangium sp. TaxID=2663208 RepID=UPI003D0BCE80
MTAAVRGDHPDYFGPNGRVSARRLFPLPASYEPGMLVLEVGAELDALYDELAELLARPDALDPDRDTGRRLAEVEAELERREQVEADLMDAAFRDNLRLPIDGGGVAHGADEGAFSSRR